MTDDLFGAFATTPEPEANQQKAYDPFAPFLVDVPAFIKSIPEVHFPPDPVFFSKDSLSQRPGMEWLNNVDCTLIYPDSNSLIHQKAQLDIFFDKLLAEATRIREGFASFIPQGFDEPLIALDTETTGLDTRVRYDYNGELIHKTKLCGICLATSDRVGYYLPVLHTEDDAIPNWDEDLIIRFLDDLHNQFIVLYHNAQYDRELCALQGVREFRPFPYFFDTQLLDFLYDVNDKKHNLKQCSEKRLGYKMITIEELFTLRGEHKGKEFINFNRIPATTATVYGCCDALQTFSLFQWYVSQPEQTNIFIIQPIPMEIDHKMVDCLRNIYRLGMPVNVKYSIYAAQDSIHRRRMVEREIYRIANREFAIGSPAEVAYLLFDEFNVPVLPTMKRGKPSNKYPKGNYGTGEELLEQLQELYPDYKILNMIILWRKLLNNVKKTLLKVACNFYTDAFTPWAKGNIAYSQTVIPTGRLSSSSGSGKSAVQVKYKKNYSYKYVRGSYTIGLNTQGVPNPYLQQIKAKKMTKLPPEAGLNIEAPYSDNVKLEMIEAAASL